MLPMIVPAIVLTILISYLASIGEFSRRPDVARALSVNIEFFNEAWTEAAIGMQASIPAPAPGEPSVAVDLGEISAGPFQSIGDWRSVAFRSDADRTIAVLTWSDSPIYGESGGAGGAGGGANQEESTSPRHDAADFSRAVHLLAKEHKGSGQSHAGFFSYDQDGRAVVGDYSFSITGVRIPSGAPALLTLHRL